jgi:hypothetical protein
MLQRIQNKITWAPLRGSSKGGENMTIQEIQKNLARLAFILEEQVNGEHHHSHSKESMEEVREARRITLDTLEGLGVNVDDDSISILNEGS